MDKGKSVKEKNKFTYLQEIWMPLKLHARQTKAWESTLQHAMLALYCTIKAGWRYFNLFSFVLYEYFLCYAFAECLNKTKAKNTQPRCVPDMFSPLYKFCSQKTKNINTMVFSSATINTLKKVNRKSKSKLFTSNWHFT